MPNPNNGNDAMRQYADTLEAQPIPGIDPTPAPKAEQPKQNPAPKNYGQVLAEAQEQKKQQIEEQKMSNGLGYIKVPMDTIPTGGMFYPEGTEVWIRAATGAEIRHWSMTNETDIQDIDNALNYMLERCVAVKNTSKVMTWSDLKELDRFFIIMSVRDFTFPDGTNELMIKLSETEEMPLRKDNIDFVKFDERVMKYYNPAKKCFTVESFRTNGGKEIKLQRPLDIFMPSTGVSNFLKGYLRRKTQLGENFNQDFLSIAPLLIPDHRGLTDDSYAAFIASCDYFGIAEYSILAWFKRIISDSIEPKFLYVDKEGQEHSTPINFPKGGLRNLFLFAVDDSL